MYREKVEISLKLTGVSWAIKQTSYRVGVLIRE